MGRPDMVGVHHVMSLRPAESSFSWQKLTSPEPQLVTRETDPDVRSPLQQPENVKNSQGRFCCVIWPNGNILPSIGSRKRGKGGTLTATLNRTVNIASGPSSASPTLAISSRGPTTNSPVKARIQLGSPRKPSLQKSRKLRKAKGVPLTTLKTIHVSCRSRKAARSCPTT